MNWQNVYSQEDAQSAFLNFQRNIIESFNACCPIENVEEIDTIGYQKI